MALPKERFDQWDRVLKLTAQGKRRQGTDRILIVGVRLKPC